MQCFSKCLTRHKISFNISIMRREDELSEHLICFVSCRAWLLMAIEPLVWYCQPQVNEAWAKEVDGAFGAYTPCAIDSVVISISHLVLLGLCCYRIWMMKKNSKVERFYLRSKCYNYVLGLLAGYCTIEPLLRLLMDISIFNLNGETGVAPYEVRFC